MIIGCCWGATSEFTDVIRRYLAAPTAYVGCQKKPGKTHGAIVFPPLLEALASLEPGTEPGTRVEALREALDKAAAARPAVRPARWKAARLPPRPTASTWTGLGRRSRIAWFQRRRRSGFAHINCALRGQREADWDRGDTRPGKCHDECMSRRKKARRVGTTASPSEPDQDRPKQPDPQDRRLLTVTALLTAEEFPGELGESLRRRARPSA